jgi:hypothetical protein
MPRTPKRGAAAEEAMGAARAMEAARRLGVQGLSQPPAPEDDGALLFFFVKLTDKLVKATEKLTDVIDSECRDFLGLAGARIFSNLQCTHPNLDLLNVLHKVEEAPPLGTPDSEEVARADRVDAAIQCL